MGHGPATVASDQQIRARELDSARGEHDLKCVLVSLRDYITDAEYNLLSEQAAQLSDSMRSVIGNAVLRRTSQYRRGGKET